MKKSKNLSDCPMGGNCLNNNIIYQAKVTNQSTGTNETYTGLTSTSWKARYGNHKQSFTNRKLENFSQLSNHIWKLKDQNDSYTITWSTLSKSNPYNPITRTCRLCLTEKYFIIFKPKGATLNSRNEFTSKCRHYEKHLICNS